MARIRPAPDASEHTLILCLTEEMSERTLIPTYAHRAPRIRLGRMIWGKPMSERTLTPSTGTFGHRIGRACRITATVRPTRRAGATTSASKRRINRVNNMLRTNARRTGRPEAGATLARFSAVALPGRRGGCGSLFDPWPAAPLRVSEKIGRRSDALKSETIFLWQLMSEGSLIIPASG